LGGSYGYAIVSKDAIDYNNFAACIQKNSPLVDAVITDITLRKKEVVRVIKKTGSSVSVKVGCSK
jgi:hypothetical protein